MDIVDIYLSHLPMSRLARWAVGDGHGFRLLNDAERTFWIKNNVRQPMVWGRKNPCQSGYFISMGERRIERNVFNAGGRD